MDNSLYLKDSEVAARYGVTRTTIWRWVRQGQDGFPRPVKLSPGCTRWSEALLADWEKLVRKGG